MAREVDSLGHSGVSYSSTTVRILLVGSQCTGSHVIILLYQQHFNRTGAGILGCVHPNGGDAPTEGLHKMQVT